MRKSRSQAQLYLRAREYAYKIFQRVPNCTLENARRIFTTDLYRVVVETYSVLNSLVTTQKTLNIAFVKMSSTYRRVKEASDIVDNTLRSAIRDCEDFANSLKSDLYDYLTDDERSKIRNFEEMIMRDKKGVSEVLKARDEALKRIPLLTTTSKINEALTTVLRMEQRLINIFEKRLGQMMKLNEELMNGVEGRMNE